MGAGQAAHASRLQTPGGRGGITPKRKRTLLAQIQQEGEGGVPLTQKHALPMRSQ